MLQVSPVTTHRVATNRAHVVVSTELGAGESPENDAEPSGRGVKAALVSPLASELFDSRYQSPNAYHTPPRATVIASPFTPPAASLHRNAITCATSRGSSTRFCG